MAAYEAGEGGYHDLARVFGVGYRTLQRWVATYRATASWAPKPPGGGRRSPIDLVVVHAVVREDPDGTSEELCRTYNRRVDRAERTTPSSFRRALARAGYVLKKNGAVRVSATDPTFSADARRSGGRSRRSIRVAWSPSTKRA